MRFFQNKYLLGLLTVGLTLSAGAQSFQKIEAVEYDAKRNRFLVSNGSSIIIRKSNGSLETFGNGAKANYGMEVYDDKLFAINSSKIMGYDLETGEEVMSLTVSGAGFLNGMANTGDGILYVTDFSSKKIYKIDVTDIENPSSTVFIDNTTTTPNGIVYDEKQKRLVFVSWGSNAPIKAIDIDSKDITVLKETSLGNCDGIDTDNQGSFFISSWSPQQISKFDNNFTKDLEKIDAPGLGNPADICYAKEIDSLAIPNVSKNTVTFVGFESTVKVNETTLDNDVIVFPNPIKVGNNLFVQSDQLIDSYELINLEGKSVFKENESSVSRVKISTESIIPGSYFLLLRSSGKSIKKKISIID